MCSATTMSTRLKLRYVVLIILFVCRINVIAAIKFNDPIYLCSKLLASTISTVCDIEYKITKRDTSIFMEKMEPKSVQEQKTKHRLFEKERWRRVRRQVASECCDKPCTVGNIIMYCPEDSKVVRENPDLFED